MVRRLDKTLADYVTIAISPALIMVLIGSLVFFLLEIFYQGRYTERLHVIMALFVMAAVLIGRISIEDGTQRASLFALPLAVVTMLAIHRFVKYDHAPLGDFTWTINVAILGLIWWCAHKLTWDCTLIDEAEHDAGEGLLQSAGLEGRATPAGKTVGKTDGEQTNPPEGTTSRNLPVLRWWQTLVERSGKPHAPGVWIVYFSLAALPLFGIGQWFLPASDEAGRRYAFRLLQVYVASGLGLLLTTSFLGLRRYLRQRHVQMPVAMASVWLAMGGLLIAGLLLLVAWLPRPQADGTGSPLGFAAGSPEQQSSRYAVRREGADVNRQPGDAAVATSANNLPTEPDAPASDKKEGESGSTADETGQANTSGGEGRDKSPDSDSQRSENAAKQDTAQQDAAQNASGSKKSENEAERSGKSDAESQNDASRQRDKDQQGTATPSNDSAREQSSPPESSQTGAAVKTLNQSHDAVEKSPPSATGWLQSIFRWFAVLLKWTFYGCLAAMILYGIWRRWREILTALLQAMQGWRDFWQTLWGRKAASASAAATAEVATAAQGTLRPFSDFTDPFAAGKAGGYSPDELVKYSFEAVEAWAREHDCGREPQQTPHEFARTLDVHAPALGDEMRYLAELYARVAYAPGTLSTAKIDRLQRVWRLMMQTQSAGERT